VTDDRRRDGGAAGGAEGGTEGRWGGSAEAGFNGRTAVRPSRAGIRSRFQFAQTRVTPKGDFDPYAATVR